MTEVCNNCAYWKESFDGHCNARFCCGNEDSDYYNVPTENDDTCDDFKQIKI